MRPKCLPACVKHGTVSPLFKQAVPNLCIGAPIIEDKRRVPLERDLLVPGLRQQRHEAPGNFMVLIFIDRLCPSCGPNEPVKP